MVKLNNIEITLWLLQKEPPGDIMDTLLDTLWKKFEWVAQPHAGHIVDNIVKETIM